MKLGLKPAVNWLVNPQIVYILVGTRDGRTQSARAWLFFFLHLDGLKTPIYTQTIFDGGIQKKVKEPQPKPPLYPSPQTHPPKNLKIWSLIPSSSSFQQILDTSG